MRQDMRYGVLLLSGLLVTGCAAEEPTGPPFDMRHDVRDLMAGLIDPAADGLWDAVGTVLDADGEHYTAPETEEDWIAVRASAMTLIEAGNLIMMGDRPVDDGQWMQYAQDMIDAAAVALAAAEAEDPDAVFDVGESGYNSCNACHAIYWIGDEQRGRTVGN